MVAIQEMQGPIVPWRPGRQDKDVSACTPDGRLPDASKDQNHIRAIFGRMGFNDQEMVALSGAHALGTSRRRSPMTRIALTGCRTMPHGPLRIRRPMDVFAHRAHQ